MFRVWDTFLFNDELDLLEARLTELAPVVYRFVLVESDLTFQGSPKPLLYQENRERFAAWSDKIVCVTATEVHEFLSPWAREHASREAVSRGLEGFWSANSVLLHGDLDEIPRASAVASLVPGDPWAFSMSFRPVAVDLEYAGYVWNGTVSAPFTWSSFTWLRDQRHVFPRLLDAGWHLTFLGGPDAMKRKIRQNSHAESIDQVDRDADRCWAEGRNLSDSALLTHVGQSDLPWWVVESGPDIWFWCISSPEVEDV